MSVELKAPKNQDLIQELLKLGWSEEAVDLGKRQDFRCHYCHRDFLASIEDYDMWQTDHLIPRSKQGLDAIENKLFACKLCNFVKRNFDPRSKASENATFEELAKIASEHVTKGRGEKQARLEKIKDVLLRAGLISQDRY